MPFTAFYPAGVADPTLIDRLTSQANLQGLLRMAVGGLQQVMRKGAFSDPDSVRKATQRFREEADPIRGFIRERITTGAEFVERSTVYNAYVAWATVNGFHQMSAARFYESFGAAIISEFPMRTTILDGLRGYRGIALQ